MRGRRRRRPRGEGARLHPVEIRDGKTYIGARHIRLGRRKDKKDTRDRIARREAAPPVTEEVLPEWKYWNDLTWRGDQGSFPHCVAYSATHRIENSPTTYPESGPVVDPAAVYARAQQLDGWPGENYDGTSVRAGAKAMKERGFISEYQRITTLQDTIDVIRRSATAGGGPVPIGIDWHRGMFSPVYEKDALGDYRWTNRPERAGRRRARRLGERRQRASADVPDPELVGPGLGRGWTGVDAVLRYGRPVVLAGRRRLDVRGEAPHRVAGHGPDRTRQLQWRCRQSVRVPRLQAPRAVAVSRMSYVALEGFRSVTPLYHTTGAVYDAASDRREGRVDTDRAAASIEIQEQDASPEDLDRLAEGLSRELSDLDVDRVTKATAGEAPPGTRAFEIVAVGALIVEFARSSGDPGEGRRRHQVVAREPATPVHQDPDGRRHARDRRRIVRATGTGHPGVDRTTRGWMMRRIAEPSSSRVTPTRMRGSDGSAHPPMTPKSSPGSSAIRRSATSLSTS